MSLPEGSIDRNYGIQQNVTNPNNVALDISRNTGFIFDTDISGSYIQLGAPDVYSASIFDTSKNIIYGGINFDPSGNFYVNKVSRIRGEDISGPLFTGGTTTGSNDLASLVSITSDSDENLYLFGLQAVSDFSKNFFIQKLEKNGDPVNGWTSLLDSSTKEIRIAGDTEAHAEDSVLVGNKIYLLGDREVDSSYNSVVCKINTSDGSLDTSFGQNGFVDLSYNNTNTILLSIIHDDNNNLLYIGGTASVDNEDSGDWLLACIDDGSGNLVNSFGNGGYLTGFFDSANGQNSCTNLLLSNNKITATGFVTENGGSQSGFGLIRLDLSGAFDTSFGDNGITTTIPDNNDGPAPFFFV